jgi:two-component system OmpR family response regulator
VRARSTVPILFLSARNDELDRVLGLELGGDDYVTKPFSTRELVSRIKALLRRARATARHEGAARPSPSILRRGRLTMAPEQHRAWIGAAEITLTATEFRLLAALLGRPGRVFSRPELATAAYPDARRISDRTVDSHVRRVRAKLRDHDADPIETVHGVGYRLRETT